MRAYASRAYAIGPLVIGALAIGALAIRAFALRTYASRAYALRECATGAEVACLFGGGLFEVGLLEVGLLGVGLFVVGLYVIGLCVTGWSATASAWKGGACAAAGRLHAGTFRSTAAAPVSGCTLPITLCPGSPDRALEQADRVLSDRKGCDGGHMKCVAEGEITGDGFPVWSCVRTKRGNAPRIARTSPRSTPCRPPPP
ncbi:hypothetical protein GCM10010344_44000 [Streptomyces bluensis]|nr:hypothetical protein GCM10010344_44000 [Streptomyces bluensis]